MDINVKESIEKWNALPELKCNNCGIVFKGEHQCDYEKLKKDNKRLREALEYYADVINYKAHEIADEYGEIARQALEDNK